MIRILLSLLVGTSLAAAQIIYAGYVPTYRTSTLSQYDYNNLTHVFAAFGNPDSAGTITIGMDIDAFVATVTANGTTKAYLSIGGGGDFSWGKDTTIYTHLFADSNRTMFVEKLVAYTLQHTLHGIDADIEGTPLNHPNYNVFIQELADSLHAHGLELTAALGAGTWGGASHLTALTLSKYDLIMTMSYGGTWSSTNLGDYDHFVSDINWFKNRGVDPKKICGGIPFYGVSYSPDTYVTLSQLYTQQHYLDQDPFYNDTLLNTNGGTVYANSWPTIKKKIDYVDTAGFGGIMIWELGQDNYGAGLSMSDTIAYYLDPTSPVQTSRPAGFSPAQFNPAQLAEVILRDVRGRRVYRSQQSQMPSVAKLSKNLAPGVYTLELIDTQGNSLRELRTFE